MYKLIACLMIISSSAFAGKISGNDAQNIINKTAQDLEVFFAASESSNCSLEGSTVKAKYSLNGRALKNSFSLKNRSGVDFAVSVNEKTSTVSIERGLLFSTDVLNVKYAEGEVSGVEMVVAAGTQIQTTVKCN